MDFEQHHSTLTFPHRAGGQKKLSSTNCWGSGLLLATGSTNQQVQWHPPDLEKKKKQNTKKAPPKKTTNNNEPTSSTHT